MDHDHGHARFSCFGFLRRRGKIPPPPALFDRGIDSVFSRRFQVQGGGEPATSTEVHPKVNSYEIKSHRFQNIIIMSSEKGNDKRVKKSVGMLLKHPGLTVWEAMRLGGFTEEEERNLALQMKIRHAFKKLTGLSTKEYAKLKAAAALAAVAIPPIPTSITIINTKKRSRIPEAEAADAKPRKLILLLDKEAKDNRSKVALRLATSLYFSEKHKDNGLSANKVEEIVKEKFDGIGPSASTIRRHANAKMEYYNNLYNDSPGDYSKDECCERAPMTKEECKELLLQMSDDEFTYVRNRCLRVREIRRNRYQILVHRSWMRKDE
jgi:hypothetical protein